MAASPEPAAGERTEAKLPKGVSVFGHSFSVSADGRYACFMEMKLDPATRSPATIGWMVDLTTGDTMHMDDFVPSGRSPNKKPLWSAPMPSPDSQYVVFTAAVPPTISVYLLRLEDHKLTKLAMGQMLVPSWAGKKIFLSSIDASGMVAPIRIYDPQAKEPKNLEVRGFVGGADREGKLLICICDASEPAKPISMKELQSKNIVLMSAEGKVLKKLMPDKTMGKQYIFSPKNKYVAFMAQGTPARSAPGKSSYVKVMSLETEEQWIINEGAIPISVTDDGLVVTINIIYGGGEGPVKIWPKGGKSGKLLTLAHGAWIVGNRVYYVTGTDQQIIKSMPLPQTESKIQRRGLSKSG